MAEWTSPFPPPNTHTTLSSNTSTPSEQTLSCSHTHAHTHTRNPPTTYTSAVSTQTFCHDSTHRRSPLCAVTNTPMRAHTHEEASIIAPKRAHKRHRTNDEHTHKRTHRHTHKHTHKHTDNDQDPLPPPARLCKQVSTVRCRTQVTPTATTTHIVMLTMILSQTHTIRTDTRAHTQTHTTMLMRSVS
jgi:hypothetical protein